MRIFYSVFIFLIGLHSASAQYSFSKNEKSINSNPNRLDLQIVNGRLVFRYILMIP